MTKTAILGNGMVKTKTRPTVKDTFSVAEVERLQELCECNTSIMRVQDEALSRVNKERDALHLENEELKRKLLDK